MDVRFIKGYHWNRKNRKDVMGKRKKTEFSECKSRLAKLEHRLRVNEERRMIYRKAKQDKNGDKVKSI